MKFALIEGKKAEAFKGLKGICPHCASEVIAKCGKIKINHWAHKSNGNCDSWWENETDWHRAWKNNYPAEWQEISLLDEKTNEKHIADVRTIHNLVIEFQHSYIDSKEKVLREQFYKNMLWIVDGTRLKRDYSRFLKGFKDFIKTNQQGVFYVDFPEEVFPKSWLNSSVPVIFDFCGLSTSEQDEIKNILWCLLPQKDIARAVVVGLNRKDFVAITYEREQLFQAKTEEKRQVLSQQQFQKQVRRQKPTQTHYYDPHKKQFVKRERL